MNTESTREAAVIRSEAHGPHWVAWVADRSGTPLRHALLVGQTREEAERRARQWAAQLEAAESSAP